MSNHAGGFATIDPRHAGDTPQSSAYGSNSPQATNKDKPHHHNKHTKTCRTRPTQPPKGHTTPALPSNHPGGFATIDPRHAGDTPQGSAYGSNSPQATNEDKPHHTNTRDIPPATTANPSHHTGTQPRNHAQVEHRAGIAKGAGISRPLARVPSLVHEGHLDAAHQRGDDVVEHGSQRRQGGEQNDVDDRDDGRVGDNARQAGVVQ